MTKPDISTSTDFDRPKLFLFKFLAHQIHPFAYAVNTFLRPALDDCLGLMSSNPQDTFNVLLSLTQTFTRFAPESELIYDDIQQFAIKLKDAIDLCFTRLDPNAIQQSSQLLQSTDQSLLAIIQQQNTGNTTYTNMYKNMSAVLTNLEKINSLPTEIQTMSSNQTKPIQKPHKQETIMNTNGRTVESSIYNGYANRTTATVLNRTITPPPGMSTVQIDKPLAAFPPPKTKQFQPPPLSSNTVSSSTIPAMDQIKTRSVSSSTISSQPILKTSYSSEYEVFDTNTQPVKKPTNNIASFPPRQNASLFTSITSTKNKPLSSSTSTLNEHYSSTLSNETTKNGHAWIQPKTNINSKNDMINNYQRDIPTPTPSTDASIRFGTASVTTSIHENIDDDWDDDISQEGYRHARFSSLTPTNTEWHSTNDSRSTNVEQVYFHQTKGVIHPHITDEYIQEFGHKQNRPALLGELSMTFGKPQSGPQASCLPIGVGLSYDELTLLSCDVHRDAQHVRLFDIQTGRLKHTISSNKQMKFHRPGAIMSNARNNILIVERDSIYITESDGRLIQTMGHRSIKQLYGIASFRDRYILTMDSKGIDHQSGEICRLLLFDPNSGQLVFEQNITINRQPEHLLKQQYIHHIPGRVLPEATSKPRFLAAHNDHIYIADLGRSLIYGTTLRNQFDLSCTTVFGGAGRGNGEMTDPSGLFIDSGGNIISADSKNDRIQLFSSDGQYKTTFKLNERIKRPSGICVNRAGTQFYVSCYLAGCVRAFDVGY